MKDQVRSPTIGKLLYIIKEYMKTSPKRPFYWRTQNMLYFQAQSQSLYKLIQNTREQDGAELGQAESKLDHYLIQFCLNRVEIGLSKCLNVFLKPTH